MPSTSDVLLTAPSGDATLLLQDAMDRTAAARGRLTLAPGDYRCGGLRLPSHLDLVLSEGAVLHAEGRYEAYAGNTVGVIAEESDRAILSARGACDIRISGRGRIAAPGAAFIAGELPDMGTHLPARLRPRTLVLEGCRNVRLEEFLITDSPMWTLHMVDCEDVTIEGLRVDNDRAMPNTDGVVIDSCRNVTIRRVGIATADDGIVLKTTLRSDGTPVGPCRGIRVQQSRIESRSCALKIGTETHSDIEDIAFEDCTIVRSNRALGLFSRDGGRIAHVAFRRIAVDCQETPDGFWGSGEAITVTLADRRASRRAGRIEDVAFEEISGTMEGAINLVADGAAGIGDVTLRHVALAQPPGRLGTGHRYDMRPTHFDLAPAPDTAGRANAFVKDESGAVIGLAAYPGGMPGLYAANIERLVLEDVAFTRPSPLPAGWNAEDRVILDEAPRPWSAP